MSVHGQSAILFLLAAAASLLMTVSLPTKRETPCSHESTRSVFDKVHIGDEFGAVLETLKGQVDEYVLSYPGRVTARKISTKTAADVGDGRGAKIVVASSRKLSSIVSLEVELLELDFGNAAVLEKKSCNLNYTGP